MCFLNALRLSTVADVLVIDATIPFVTAGIAWLVIGEREDWVTLAATVAAVVGVAVMMGAAASGGRLSGNLLAFGMAVLMSVVLVLIRRNPGVSMLPAVGLSAFLCALIVLPFARPLAVSGEELFLLALFGASQFGLGLLLLALGHAAGLRDARRPDRRAADAARHALGLAGLRRDAGLDHPGRRRDRGRGGGFRHRDPASTGGNNVTIPEG